MLGGGVPGLLSVRPHFCWGGVGAAKGLLPRYLVPKGNQPTACTLALWWLKFGPSEPLGHREYLICLDYYFDIVRQRGTGDNPVF